MERDVLEGAHEHSTWHRAELAASDQCGCYHCREVFPPRKIVKWTDKGDTAMCPYCGIDSVIGSAAGISLTPAFLREMQAYWFRGRPRPSRVASLLHTLLGPRHRRRWLEYQALLERAEIDREYHREAILASRQCGCYWCMAIFPPTAITEWVDEGARGVARTALCPYCGEAGVLGSAGGYPITRRFLRDLRRPYF